jgi:hypothetical protein
VNALAERPMSPEEQFVMMEINRRLTEDKLKRGEWFPIPLMPIAGK